MKKGKYAKRTPFVKTLAVAMVLVTLIGCAIGGTLAWLTAETQQVVNTFTVGNIKIDLKETDSKQDTDNNEDTNSYKMIPGWTITKDPVATVLANSEDCYLFVKVIESTNAKFSDYMSYDIAEGWEKVPVVDDEGNDVIVDGKAVYEDGVYYRVVKTNTSNQPFGVIKNNTVSVRDAVTETMMEALDGIDAEGKDNTDAAKAEIDARPTLTFQAYAVQLYKNNTEKFEPAEAWAKVAPPASNP